MNTVSFQNKGLIDPKAITTFGVSAKDNDDAIGFFGTGLKYAIAILLRERCSISIFRGEEEFVFDTVPMIVRNKEFDVVRMNGVELGFTLELGKTWEMWQAFRELYCNTLDEHGDTCGNAVPLEEDCTTIIVAGEAFYAEYIDKDKIMLLGKPQHELGKVELREKMGTSIFYQGVRVGAFQRPSIMTYNLLSKISLTEDRTIKEMKQVDDAIRKSILDCTDKALIKKFVTAPKDTYEATVDLNWFETPGETFMEVMDDVNFKDINNTSLLHFHKKHKKEEFKAPTDVELTDIEAEQLQKAIDFSNCLDFPVDHYPIHVTDDVKDDVLGMAYGEEIYIARRTFMMGTKMVAATLIEEYIHLDKGFADCAYPMQNFLFEKLVSMGEQVIGEAL